MDLLLNLAKYKYENQILLENKQNNINKLNSIINNFIKEQKFIFINPNEKEVIYTPIPYEIALNLTNLIYDQYSKYTTLKIALVNKEYIINVNNTNILTIILFLPIANTLDISLIKSIEFKNKYNISNYDSEDINNLIIEIPKDLNTNLVIQNNIPSSDIKKKILSNIPINNIISLSYINDILKNNKLKYETTWDMIILNHNDKLKIINNIKLQVQKLDEYLFKINKHDNFYILHDYRLTKYSIYIQHKKTNKKIYLVNMYNLATYELLPVCKLYKIKIPHKLVLLRFLYIDLYFTNNNPTYYNIIYTRIINTYYLPDYQVTWIGCYQNENYDKITYNMKFGQLAMPYRPLEYFNIHNKLKLI